MKKILLLSMLLVACSSADTTPTSSEATVLPAEATDASLAPSLAADELPAPEGALSTPVEPPPVPEAAAVADNGALPQSHTPPDESALPAPIAHDSASEPSVALPPVVATPGAGTKPDRNSYDEYREYQDRVRQRAQSENEFERRALFPHEDGAFQAGVDYIYKPFSQYDFDSSATTQKFGESKGVGLSFNYFPVRSLSYGRIGVGAQAAAYSTEFEYKFAGGLPIPAKKNMITNYGARLIYEFHYFLGQLFVPHAFYAYDKVRVRPFVSSVVGANYAGNQFVSQSYGGGMHLNLNRLESSAASKALASTGVRKFYLSYAYQVRDENTGSSHYLGLRFEY